MEIFIAIVLGIVFGFVLQRVGAADPDKILGMLTLKDLHLMKAILTGIGASSIVLFLGLMVGIFEGGNLSVKAMYPGVMIGGVLLGFGWALSGFCPGTGVVAAGSGRKDAFVFIIGGLLGAWLFAVTYDFFKGTWVLENILGGKATLVVTEKSTALLEASWSPVVAIMIGALMLLMAKLLPERLRLESSGD